MLEIIVTSIPTNDWEKVRRLASKFSEISIKASEDFSGDHSNLKFSCPNALTITQEQEKKFGEVLKKIFYYEKRSAQLSKDKIDYGLSEIAFRKPKMLLNYETVRIYLENLKTYDLRTK